MKNGTVRMVESLGGGGRQVTVIGRERHDGQTFYRVAEIPGALFLNSSLFVPKPEHITAPCETCGAAYGRPCSYKGRRAHYRNGPAR